MTRAADHQRLRPVEEMAQKMPLRVTNATKSLTLPSRNHELEPNGAIHALALQIAHLFHK